jgi:VWFA-related protein
MRLCGWYTEKVMLRGVAALLVSGFLGLGGAARSAPPNPQISSEAQSPETQPKFEGEIDVSLSTIVVRAVDTWGAPILNLRPEDFRVRAGKREIPVVAVDWVSGEETAPPASQEPVEAAAGEAEEVTAPAPRPAGRLVVFFVQADLNPTRISGQLRLRLHTRELLDALHPEDRMAVVSYDSHLKLRQDFTRDRDAVYAALDQGMLWGKEPDIAPDGPESLAAHFDFAAALRAASPERALEVTARSLESFPGEKTMIFLGWGLGRFGGGGVDMVPAFAPAVRALAAARTSVFVLDVTSADGHSLEVGLQNVADATGGLYLKTFRLPNLAVRTLSQAISGYYVLTLDPSQLPEKVGRAGHLEIELRDGRRGTVLARPVAWRGER